MPATARQTRQQIRRAIGVQTRAIYQDGGAVSSSPTDTSTKAQIVDATLAFGSTDEHRGKWVIATDSNSSAETRKVIASSPEERSFTVAVPFSNAPSTAWSYELWEEALSPTTVHSFMNDAIIGTARKGSINVESDSFHTGGSIVSFPLSSTWTGVRQVAFRHTYVGKMVATMDSAPDSVSANTTVATDSADYREGAAAARLTVAAGESSGTAIANSSFSPIDLRGYNQMELWFKTSGSITSSAFTVSFMQGSSAEVTVSLPASGGDSWTFHKASISAPESLSSVTAVQIATGSSDGGATTLWVDGVEAVRDGTEQYQPLPREYWTVSQQNREVKLIDLRVGYAKLRITGVRRPNSLNSDSDICEVDPNYVIAYTRGMALLSEAQNIGGRRDAAAINGANLLQYAETLRNRMSAPSNIRWLDD